MWSGGRRQTDAMATRTSTTTSTNALMLPPLTLLLLLIAAGTPGAQASSCTYMELLRHLNVSSSNQKLLTRPVKNWTTPTEVLLDLVVFGIIELDEKFQTVTSQTWVEMIWMNEFLAWNPSEFCGMNYVTIPRSYLWIPDISIFEDISDTSSVQQSKEIILQYDGFMSGKSKMHLTSTCHLNLYLFPVDVQICNYTFLSMSYDATAIELGTVYNKTALATISALKLVTEGEWELSRITTFLNKFHAQGSPQQELVYVVVLTRKPMLYVINLIVPLLYFLLLDLGSFFIRGEKINFKVTILLSISVLLLILKDILPSTEKNLPLIANLAVVTFALVGIGVLEAMLVDFLRGLDQMLPCCPCTAGKTGQGVDSRAESPEPEEKVQMEPKMKGCELYALMVVLQEMKEALQETVREGARKPGRWARVAEILDYIYFSLYFLVVLSYLTTLALAWVGGFSIGAFLIWT